MALAHHDAAGRDQGRGGEAEFVGAEQRADHDVTAGAETAVDLHDDAAAQPLAHQRLVGFGKADFPGDAGMLDRGEGRGAGAALEARDGHVVGARLRNARGHRADADFGDELHRDLAVRIDVLEVVDELRQILDRIDVVMRRRRDQADARRRMPHARDGRVDLVAGQLAAFAGLGALRHLDLHHVGVDEIFRRHAEAARGDLLDRRAHRIAVRHRLEAVGFLAAFAGVGLAADPVHRDRQRGVRLARDRAKAHRAGGEALDDVLGRLDLVERDRLALLVVGALDPEQAAQRQQPLGLLVEDLCKRAVALLRIAAHGVLQRARRIRRSTRGPRRGCGRHIRRRHRARSCRPAHRRTHRYDGARSLPRSRQGRRLRSACACRQNTLRRNRPSGRRRRRSARRNRTGRSRCPSSTSPSAGPCRST